MARFHWGAFRATGSGKQVQKVPLIWTVRQAQQRVADLESPGKCGGGDDPQVGNDGEYDEGSLQKMVVVSLSSVPKVLF